MSEETKNNNVKRPFPWRKYGLLMVALLLVGRTVGRLPRTNWSLKNTEQKAVIPKDISQKIPAAKKINHVVLISIDTCRADHLGCYGYSRKTSPNIDAVAADGTLFHHVVTPVPLTLPAHSSMLTGTGPLYHKVRDNLDYRLGDSNITLAEILKENGFETAAAIGAFVLDEQFGLNQGFDIYDDNLTEENKMVPSLNERSAEEISRFAVSWLGKKRAKKTFLFLHYYDPHAPYKDHKLCSFSSYPFLCVPKDRYDSEIAYTDHYIGRVIKKLKELNIYDSTLVVITADHGESLGEHSENSHGYFIYHGTVHVPLIIKAPQRATGKIVYGIAGLIDIVPTICSVLGITVPDHIQGKDLSAYLLNKNNYIKERDLYCESLYPTKYGLSPVLAIVNNHYKYIHTSNPELYDLRENPQETKNLLNKNTKIAGDMRNKLSSILEEKGFDAVADSKVTLDEDSRNRLESLGYVASRSVDESAQFDQMGRDPKEFVETFEEINNYSEKIAILFSQKKLDKAKKICNLMLAKWPDMEDTHYLLGLIASHEQDANGAITHFTRYLASSAWDSNNSGMRVKPVSRFRTASISLANEFVKKGRYDKAIEQYKNIVSYAPCDLQINAKLISLCFKQNKFRDTLKYCKKILTIDPHMSQPYTMMGHIYLNQGYIEKAITNFNKAIKLTPDSKMAQQGLSKAINQKKILSESIISMTASLQKDPNQVQVHKKLGTIFYRMNNFNKAIHHWNTALQLDPNQPEVLNELAFTKAVHPEESFYDPNQAVQLAQKACELTGYETLQFLDTLAVAYASANRFPDAVKAAQKALNLATYLKHNELIAEIQEHIELFKSGRPFRQE